MTSEVTQADSGMDGQSVERAELVWANLPTNRPWASLPTHEKALVCHTLARLTAQSGEGRSGAGEDSNLDARKAVNGVLAGLLAPLMSDTPKMIEIGNQACTEILASLAALNARQSGEGEREALREALAEAEKPSDNSDPWYQLGWYKDRLERAEIERDEWKDRAMSSRLSALNARQSGEGRSGAGEDAEHLVRIFRGLPLHGDAGCDKLSDDEWRQVALAALNARQSGEGEREALREALAEAYRKGATDVHNYWVNNPGEPPRGDPEFGESASDYAAAALDIFDSAATLRATDDAGGA